MCGLLGGWTGGDRTGEASSLQSWPFLRVGAIPETGPSAAEQRPLSRPGLVCQATIPIRRLQEAACCVKVHSPEGILYLAGASDQSSALALPPAVQPLDLARHPLSERTG